MTFHDPKPGDRIRVAVDVGVGYRAHSILAAVGVDVVHRAQAFEADRTWFEAAVQIGIHAVISPDIDLAGLAHRAGVRCLRLPCHPKFRARGQAAWIIHKLTVWSWLPLVGPKAAAGVLEVREVADDPDLVHPGYRNHLEREMQKYSPVSEDPGVDPELPF
jgi:hypothetical protein